MHLLKYKNNTETKKEQQSSTMRQRRLQNRKRPLTKQRIPRTPLSGVNLSTNHNGALSLEGDHCALIGRFRQRLETLRLRIESI